ncbi:MAG: peroxiredoxin [Candidatus Cloacimonetes bacterium]|nr:peroxiredoxin [Candidatus Cloacimonadota bacterium]
MSEIRIPLLGDKFPELKVHTTKGFMNIPRDFEGKWFVFFSHPADFTPVCTTEFYSIQKRYSDFKALNCELIGLSIDQIYSHLNWLQWIKQNLSVEVEFPLIAASEKIAENMGLKHPGKGTNTVRALYIVDEKGIIRTLLYYPHEIGRSVKEILRIIRMLQLSDRESVSFPADWPENDLIKDNVIISPPTNSEQVKRKITDCESFDWWFCHKKIKQ